ncbi:hypothetical protein C9374_007720 [Naegleria lovaniensis]|uniref:Uncharacterized protein n=1 Tax=Naegleria lovaniensis TaxID=51637 RepID=A0AA88GKJ3_NAELO|nr:uncharacterized protein C9374_007720 [Naegleria lovaniensis]KAG2379082.1 hypothetical protein C9374_007720 [Naegleria lovaniensis]
MNYLKSITHVIRITPSQFHPNPSRLTLLLRRNHSLLFIVIFFILLWMIECIAVLGLNLQHSFKEDQSSSCNHDPLDLNLKTTTTTTLNIHDTTFIPISNNIPINDHVNNDVKYYKSNFVITPSTTSTPTIIGYIKLSPCIKYLNIPMTLYVKVVMMKDDDELKNIPSSSSINTIKDITTSTTSTSTTSTTTTNSMEYSSLSQQLNNYPIVIHSISDSIYYSINLKDFALDSTTSSFIIYIAVKTLQYQSYELTLSTQSIISNNELPIRNKKLSFHLFKQYLSKFTMTTTTSTFNNTMTTNTSIYNTTTSTTTPTTTPTTTLNNNSNSTLLSSLPLYRYGIQLQWYPPSPNILTFKYKVYFSTTNSICNLDTLCGMLSGNCKELSGSEFYSYSLYAGSDYLNQTFFLPLNFDDTEIAHLDLNVVVLDSSKFGLANQYGLYNSTQYDSRHSNSSNYTNLIIFMVFIVTIPTFILILFASCLGVYFCQKKKSSISTTENDVLTASLNHRYGASSFDPVGMSSSSSNGRHGRPHHSSSNSNNNNNNNSRGYKKETNNEIDRYQYNVVY